MNQIKVSLGERSYPIYVAEDAAARLGDLAAAHGLSGAACIVSQHEIWARWKEPVKASLGKSGIPFRVHLPSSRKKSEQMKSAAELLNLVKTCSELDGKGKSVFVVAIGGGVVGDLAGFAASIYRRGIPLVQVPTTLTAQVDSAIGGKNGVDLPVGKNLLGTIYQPRFVLIDPAFLRTLPDAMLRDGLAEVIKCAVIRDEGLFNFLEKNRAQIMTRSSRHLERLIGASARIKASVVSRDEYDKKGLRLILNFGHTIGHAVEAAGSYAGYTHGQAISIGMMCAVGLSDSLGILKDRALSKRLEGLLSAYGLPVRMSRRIDLEKVMKALGYDKKNVDGMNRFILVEKIGKTVIHRGVPHRLIHEELTKRRS